jgi:perosamine synthetase
MYHIVLRDSLADKRDLIMRALKEQGIETREGFTPFNLQEIFLQRGWTHKDDCPNSTLVSYSSFYLPTSFVITENELDYVATKFISIIDDFIKK